MALREPAPAQVGCVARWTMTLSLQDRPNALMGNGEKSQQASLALVRRSRVCTFVSICVAQPISMQQREQSVCHLNI